MKLINKPRFKALVCNHHGRLEGFYAPKSVSYSFSAHCVTAGRSPSASGKKNTVRFDLDNHQTSSTPPQPPIRSEEKSKTERRSSSVETFTRKTSTTSSSHRYAELRYVFPET